MARPHSSGDGGNTASVNPTAAPSVIPTENVTVGPSATAATVPPSAPLVNSSTPGAHHVSGVDGLQLAPAVASNQSQNDGKGGVPDSIEVGNRSVAGDALFTTISEVTIVDQDKEEKDKRKSTIETMKNIAELKDEGRNVDDTELGEAGNKIAVAEMKRLAKLIGNGEEINDPELENAINTIVTAASRRDSVQGRIAEENSSNHSQEEGAQERNTQEPNTSWRSRTGGQRRNNSQRGNNIADNGCCIIM